MHRHSQFLLPPSLVIDFFMLNSLDILIHQIRIKLLLILFYQLYIMRLYMIVLLITSIINEFLKFSNFLICKLKYLIDGSSFSSTIILKSNRSLTNLILTSKV